MQVIHDLRHIWNVIYNARRNKSHRPTSQNTVSLPRKMNVINDLRHIWNVISNAWSK